MAKKRLDTAAITNELANSAFFPTTPATRSRDDSARTVAVGTDEVGSSAEGGQRDRTLEQRDEREQISILGESQMTESADSLVPVRPPQPPVGATAPMARTATSDHKPIDHAAGQSTSHSPAHSIAPLLDQSTRQSIDQLTEQLSDGPLGKPKGFYISEKLDKRLDLAVAYFHDQHHLKIDRSILVAALLSSDQLWTQEHLNQLIDRLIQELTKRLTSR